MNLTLKREFPTANSMTGLLYVDGVFECFILEDIPRPKKVYGKTAIPAGTYRVVITHSPRFKKPMPLLLNVPGFEGIRIHAGNTADDTEGCLLPGRTRSKDFVGQSVLAYNALFAKIKAALDKGEIVTISILNAAS
ncbi:DUF5675 family protein [Methylobacillus sp.]|uniref:DUF5675 family protein n=1 Tax=Methylobacillus sp. TaxID=56818 RepID=UPI0012BFBD52|nr:DUF5675 family protein [Methylobacillus sp.]MPS48558.1 hypothetical protein [Methylobacillus sp.]